MIVTDAVFAARTECAGFCSFYTCVSESRCSKLVCWCSACNIGMIRACCARSGSVSDQLCCLSQIICVFCLSLLVSVTCSYVRAGHALYCIRDAVLLPWKIIVQCSHERMHHVGLMLCSHKCVLTHSQCVELERILKCQRRCSRLGC